MNAAINSQGSKARTTAMLCFGLALLTMATTSWFVVEGIQATEPESSARWAKVASGVLLLILEAAAFGLAGQWPEHKKVLRPLGWSILALEICLMSVSQISIGLTAGKAASNGAGTIDEIRAQAKESRAAAEALRADADKLRKSKHGWLQEQAAKKSGEAAEQSKSAAAAVASLEKSAVLKVSTPIVEIVGQGGLIALSVALSLALSLSGIVLMHVAGSLWRRASGALPVDQQILELLHRIHGGSAAPAQTPVAMQVQAAPVAPAPAPAAPVQAAVSAPFSFIGFKKAPAAPIGATPAPALPVTDFKPAGTVAPSGFSFSSKTAMAGAGALAALSAAPVTHAAPAPVHEKAPAVPSVATANSALVSVQSGASETVHPGASVSVQSSAPQSAPPGASETVPTGASVSVQSGASVSVQSTAKKPRAKRAVSAKLDTGTDGKAGARFKRIKAGVMAGKIRPSIRGIQAVEGGSQDVVLDYLRQLETEGVIVRAGRGFVLVKKGSSK
jgi:hypothetical protein